MSHDDCVFCRIIAGQLPGAIVCQDDHALAFMDINPVHPGHTLVVARRHFAAVYDMPPADLAAVAAMAQRVARAVRDTFRPDGLNLLQANGPGAAQSVQHFHVHVLPRHLGDGLAMNWTPRPGRREDIAAAAEALARALT